MSVPDIDTSICKQSKHIFRNFFNTSDNIAIGSNLISFKLIIECAFKLYI